MEQRVRVFIEAAQHTRLRYRYDETTRKQKSAMNIRVDYPYAYGFILGTEKPGQDALDCFILSTCPRQPGSIVSCTILDAFIFHEDEEEDIKILARLTEDTENLDVDLCKGLIDRFLLEVFKDWPAVKVSPDELMGKREACKVLEELRNDCRKNT